MLKIFNTLSRKKEDFKPIHGKKVLFYQCGPTVYWTQHIGNMRAMVLADLIRRSLEYLDYKVKFVRNYTDVGHLVGDDDEGEDKMMKAAKRDDLSPQEIAEKYIAQFETDVKALNCEEPSAKPRATEYIAQMQNMVQILIDKGFAYATDLAIYFDISKVKDYTKLSGQKLEMNQAEAGKGEVGDADKKNPADFAVWFFKAGSHEGALQTWPHKFDLGGGKAIEGEGFPGWHLECSAMCRELLGETIDIHMGGIEHIPVHHTNEIAQSEAASGAKFVDYWIHNEHLNVDGGKMSKSEGTSYALADIIGKGYDPLVLRYFFLGSHYRSKQNFTWEALKASKTALDKLYSFIQNQPDKDPEIPSGAKERIQKRNTKIVDNYKKDFECFISDDFNIPASLAVVWEIIKDEFLSYSEKKRSILDFDKVLGLNLSQIKSEEIPEQIKSLAEARWQARQRKDWIEADRARDELAELGWQMEDGQTDYKLKKTSS